MVRYVSSLDNESAIENCGDASSRQVGWRFFLWHASGLVRFAYGRIHKGQCIRHARCCQQNGATGRASKEWKESFPLANDAESIHTPTMSLKNAALLALIGIVLLTVLVVVGFISTVLGVMRDLIPAMALLTSLVHVFASLSVLVFFYVFYRTQS